MSSSRGVRIYWKQVSPLIYDIFFAKSQIAQWKKPKSSYEWYLCNDNFVPFYLLTKNWYQERCQAIEYDWKPFFSYTIKWSACYILHSYTVQLLRLSYLPLRQIYASYLLQPMNLYHATSCIYALFVHIYFGCNKI